MNHQEVVLERINKSRIEEMNKGEIEYQAEQYSQDLKQQYADSEALEVIDKRLRGNKDIVLLEVAKRTISERLIPFKTELSDLRREVGYLDRIRCFLADLFINAESIDRLIQHTDKEIEDINDRINILNFEKEQIINGEV